MKDVIEVSPNHAWSGSRYIDVLNPQPEDIVLDEIAVGLSREPRFGGACTSIFWSVAQHTMLCHHLAVEDGIEDRQILAQIVFHDAPEYMLRDLIRPVKRNCPGYEEIEVAWWRAISARFGLPKSLAPEVKHYDNLALAVERKCLIAADSGQWPGIPDAGRRLIPHWLVLLPMETARQRLRGMFVDYEGSK